MHGARLASVARDIAVMPEYRHQSLRTRDESAPVGDLRTAQRLYPPWQREMRGGRQSALAKNRDRRPAPLELRSSRVMHCGEDRSLASVFPPPRGARALRRAIRRDPAMSPPLPKCCSSSSAATAISSVGIRTRFHASTIKRTSLPVMDIRDCGHRPLWYGFFTVIRKFPLCVNGRVSPTHGEQAFGNALHSWRVRVAPSPSGDTLTSPLRATSTALRADGAFNEERLFPEDLQHSQHSPSAQEPLLEWRERAGPAAPPSASSNEIARGGDRCRDRQHVGTHRATWVRAMATMPLIASRWPGTGANVMTLDREITEQRLKQLVKRDRARGDNVEYAENPIA